MEHIPAIDISDFDYPLPEDRIAQYPLADRDRSKLLIYRDGRIGEDLFFNLPEHLPDTALLVSNRTRVIQARLQFRKDTGALIEVFCLEPLEPTREIQQAFEQPSGVVWKCLVGNSKKWKEGELTHRFEIDGESVVLSAMRRERVQGHSAVEFRWNPSSRRFSEILQGAGLIPLPPYMRRESEESDKDRYQTIYARAEGSVAAPTAGLHFTPRVFSALGEKNIRHHEVVLHVGAGTFKPVSGSGIAGHEMHTEQIQIPGSTIEALISRGESPVIAVGTTTLRTLESLYWHGVKALAGKAEDTRIDIRQWDPYLPEYGMDIPPARALEKILQIMERNRMDTISGQTQLMVVPGYRFRIPDILLTNFHMPKSTLLLLVSAFIGNDWKEVYRFALEKDFRFLSYGDACLFYRGTIKR